MKYRVVKITKNVDEYPECAKDTAEFPHLVRYVSDEMDLFIVDEAGKLIDYVRNHFAPNRLAFVRQVYMDGTHRMIKEWDLTQKEMTVNWKRDGF